MRPCRRKSRAIAASRLASRRAAREKLRSLRSSHSPFQLAPPLVGRSVFHSARISSDALDCSRCNCALHCGVMVRFLRISSLRIIGTIWDFFCQRGHFGHFYHFGHFGFRGYLCNILYSQTNSEAVGEVPFYYRGTTTLKGRFTGVVSRVTKRPMSESDSTSDLSTRHPGNVVIS